MKFAKTTLLSSAAILSAIPSVAFAQTSSGDEFIDEIIVIGARGRQENEIEVPIAVTVFTAEEIKDANIERVDDFIGLTSGVTIANSQDSGTNFITIRGVSQTRNGEPPVAVLLDGVLQVDARAFDQPLFDVSSIEVLKGPQGALYGRNATQGAIIINTAGPTDEFEGYVQGSAASGSDFAVEASVSGPLSDTISYRASARYRDRDGQLDNLTLNEQVDFAQELALRGHLHWDIADNFTADLRGSYVDTDGGSLNFTYQPAFPIDTATGLPQNFDFARLDADIVDRDFFANNLGNDQREVAQISLRLKYDLGFADLTSVSAYDTITQLSRGDQFPYTAASSINPAPPFPFFDGTQTQFVDVDAFSQELRLTSTYDSPLRWMVGGYYLSTDRFISSTTGDDLEQGIAEIRRTAAFNATNPINSFFGDDNSNEAWALFANIDYAVTEQLELAFAGRFDSDSRTQNVSQENGFYANGALVGTAGTPGGVNEETFSEFQPKVTARYLFNDSTSIYGSWGRGFRSGQFNQNGVGAAAAGAGIAGIQDVIGEEVTETFEVGVKSNWGGVIDFNGALYDTQVENAPYFVFIGAVGAQVLVPIEQVSIQGGEFELSADIGENFDVYLGASFSNSEIEEYSVNPAAIGNFAPYVPKASLNAGAQYRTSLTDTLGIFARVDYENRGQQFWDPENSTARSAIDLINLRAGIEDNDGRWSLIGSVINASDEIYNSEWVAGGFAHSAAPRQYKLDLRYNF